MLQPELNDASAKRKCIWRIWRSCCKQMVVPRAARGANARPTGDRRGREGGRLNIIRRDRDGWRKSNPWHCARARSRGEKESLFNSVGIASERLPCHVSVRPSPHKAPRRANERAAHWEITFVSRACSTFGQHANNFVHLDKETCSSVSVNCILHWAREKKKGFNS